MGADSVDHIVDDVLYVRSALTRVLRAAGFTTFEYDNGLALIDIVQTLTRGCLLIDIHMPKVNGIEVLTRLRQFGVRLPVIVMTGVGDVQTAVRAMKAGATDFIEKPLDVERLIATIETALRTSRERSSRHDEATDAAKRIATLSGREREVLESIVAGNANKEIAFELGISVRTVEVHRARMLERLESDTIAQAVRLAVLASLVPLIQR